MRELVHDLNSLIETGVDISGLCKSYPLRIAQYRAVKKEVSLLMQLSENFANSKIWDYWTPKLCASIDTFNEMVKKIVLI